MSYNLKIASVVVSTLAITFSSMTLVKLASTFFEEQQQQIDQGGVMIPSTPFTPYTPDPHSPVYMQRVKKGSTGTHLPKMNTVYPTTSSNPATTKVARSKTEKTKVSKTPSSKKVETDKEFMARLNNRKITSTERVIGIVVVLVSIFTSFMIFGAVTDDYDYNALKRHLLLPFVVVQYVINFFHIVVIFYTAGKYSDRLNVLICPLLVYAAMVFVTVVGVSFVGAYFRFLRGIGSRSYFKMEDVEEQEQKGDDFNEKKPLA